MFRLLVLILIIASGSAKATCIYDLKTDYQIDPILASPFFNGSANPCWLTEFNDKVFFIANHSPVMTSNHITPTRDLFYYNPNSNSTHLLLDRGQKPIHDVQQLKVNKGKLYLIKEDEVLSLDHNLILRQERDNLSFTPNDVTSSVPDEAFSQVTIGNKTFFSTLEDNKQFIYLLENDEVQRLDIGSLSQSFHASFQLIAFNNIIYFIAEDETSASVYKIAPSNLIISAVLPIHDVTFAKLVSTDNFLLIQDYNEQYIVNKVDDKENVRQLPQNLSLQNLDKTLGNFSFFITEYTSTGSIGFIYDLDREVKVASTNGSLLDLAFYKDKLVYATLDHDDMVSASISYSKLDTVSFHHSHLLTTSAYISEKDYYQQDVFHIIDSQLITVGKDLANREQLISIDLSTDNVTFLDINPYQQRTPLHSNKNLLFTETQNNEYFVLDSLLGHPHSDYRANLSKPLQYLPKSLFIMERFGSLTLAFKV